MRTVINILIKKIIPSRGKSNPCTDDRNLKRYTSIFIYYVLTMARTTRNVDYLIEWQDDTTDIQILYICHIYNYIYIYVSYQVSPVFPTRSAGCSWYDGYPIQIHYIYYQLYPVSNNNRDLAKTHRIQCECNATDIMGGSPRMWHWSLSVFFCDWQEGMDEDITGPCIALGYWRCTLW